MQPTFFSIVRENAFHGPHNSWLAGEVVHHVALAIVSDHRQTGSNASGLVNCSR